MENKTGLEQMVDIIVGAIADEKVYRADGKTLNDYGRGMVDTMQKCLNHADRLLAEERARQGKKMVRTYKRQLQTICTRGIRHGRRSRQSVQCGGKEVSWGVCLS